MKKIAIITLAVLTLAACGDMTQTKEEKESAQRLIDTAYRSKNYGKLLMLADSLERMGALSRAESYYWQGYANERMMQHRAAEFYLKSAINEVKNSTDAEDLVVYAKSASYLTNDLSVRGDYEGALKIAVPVAERLEALHCDTTSDYTNLLIFIGCCQSRYGLSDEAAKESYDRAYKMHLANIEKTHTTEAYKNAIAGVINIAYNCIGIRHFDEALTWTDRYGKLLSQYEMRSDAQPDYVDKQWSRYNIYLATIMEGLDRKEDAAKAYHDYQQTAFSQTPESKIEAADFLIASERWEEAADCYKALDNILNDEQTELSLDDIQNKILKKYRTNLMAGRRDTANAVARHICNSLEAAITQSHELDAKELETVHQKEAQIIEQQAATSKRRMMTSLVTLAILLAVFTVYMLYRRRTMHRIKKEYKELKESHVELLEHTTSKERTESEQRIAHAIQTKMLPDNSLRNEDLDLFAKLIPSEKVGGDLYDFFVRDKKLFFCIGDISGKGVPASLEMAVTQLKFRTAIAQESQPNRIVATINKAIAKDNDSQLFVTLFVGVLDLQTGRLNYCNAGHCPPILIGSGIGLLPVDQNIALGLQSDWQFTNQETLIDPGTVIFVHTKGLVEAKDKDHNPFGQQRIMGEALQGLHGLDPSPQPLIERMTATVSRFVGDLKQDDDITMLAIRYLKRAAGVRYQRSISLHCNTEETLRLGIFPEEVCKAIRIDKRTTTDIVQTVKEAATNMMNHAYPEGTKGVIHIEACADSKQLQFVIRDHGEPFDPTSTIEHQNMDSIVYERIRQTQDEQDGLNVLTLIKKIG